MIGGASPGYLTRYSAFCEPFGLRQPVVNLDIGTKANKHDMNPDQVLAMALENLHHRFPQDE